MTSAPDNLLAVRNLLLTYLNVDKGSVRTADLEPAEVGIVGDPNHRGGYHCGEDRVVPNDYSVVESSRDRAGLAKWACALDVGLFRVTTPKGTFDLPHYSRWLVAQCIAGTDDTRDIREVIYSPDGKTVRRWDRLGRRASGDSSHLFHTHQSYFRDAIEAGRDQTAVIRRYLTSIGLLEDPDVITDEDKAAIATEVLGRKYRDYISDPTGKVARPVSQILLDARTDSARALAQVAALRVEVAQLAGRDLVDEQEIVAGILAGLPAQAIVAALPAGLAKQVADELAARLAG